MIEDLLCLPRHAATDTSLSTLRVRHGLGLALSQRVSIDLARHNGGFFLHSRREDLERADLRHRQDVECLCLADSDEILCCVRGEECAFDGVGGEGGRDPDSKA